MKVLRNNSGVTLVELIIGTLLLAIAALMLLRGFTSSARLVNSAMLYKNASAAAASTVELQSVQTSNDEDIKIVLDNTLNKSGNSIITIVAQKKSAGTTSNISCQVEGMYIVAKDSKGTQLKYKEFLPNDFSFDINADEVDS